MQEDPDGYIDGANRYDFEENNPISKLDPSGTVSIGIVNPDDHNGVGGHAFVIVNTPNGPQVYTFTLPGGWYGPIPLNKYLYGRPPGDNINIYQLPDVNDADVKKELDDMISGKSATPFYGKGGEVCSTQSAKALEGTNIPNDLRDLLDQFDSRDGIKGPSWLEYYIEQYTKNHNGTVTKIKGNPGGPKSSGSSSSASSSSSSSSSLLWWWLSS
jgi:hypothetical protein